MAGASGATGRGPGQPGHLRQLEEWMRSYRPAEQFDTGGVLLRDLDLPDFRIVGPDETESNRPRPAWAFSA